MSKQIQNNSIDFVIAWVDGSDPDWQKEKSKYQADVSSQDDSKVRYRDWDNLQYWFRAVEKYAPWVRRIHFVTWGHVPVWLDTENPKIHIVKHEDFIPKEYLPTYNSHTIELNLHRIQDLAEQFVYFNDDMFLNAPLCAEDFFKNGLPRDILGLDCIAFGRNSAGLFNANDVGLVNDHFKSRECFKNNKEKWLNYRYGIKVPVRSLIMLHKRWFPGFFYQHISSNFLKSTFEEVWEAEYEVLDATCKCKFRDNSNVNQWLMKYWQLAKGNFFPRKKNMGLCFHVEKDITKLLTSISDGTPKIICINDTIKTEDFENKREQVKRAFQKKLPDKSSFEK